MQAPAHDVHFALRPLDASPPPLHWLDDGERNRLSVITAPLRRRQFVGAHCLAREVAAGATGMAPEGWGWQVGADHRRRLMHPSGETFFVSVSHSGDWIAVALGRQPVGADLECHARPRPWAMLARQLFPPDRAEAIGSDPGRFRCAWALAEAWSKRSGRGIRRSELRRWRFDAAGAGDAEAWSGPMPGQGAWALAAWPGARLRAPGLSVAVGWRFAVDDAGVKGDSK